MIDGIDTIDKERYLASFSSQAISCAVVMSWSMVMVSWYNKIVIYLRSGLKIKTLLNMSQSLGNCLGAVQLND